MLVESLLPIARERLVTIGEEAPLIEAARRLRTGTDIVLTCDSTGRLVGIITKTDVVGQISHCLGASCRAAARLTMRSDVEICLPGESLNEVWRRMAESNHRNLPIIDAERFPLGVLTARDVLKELLSESENEEVLLRDYVMGLGYR